MYKQAWNVWWRHTIYPWIYPFIISARQANILLPVIPVNNYFVIPGEDEVLDTCEEFTLHHGFFMH